MNEEELEEYALTKKAELRRETEEDLLLYENVND